MKWKVLKVALVLCLGGVIGDNGLSWCKSAYEWYKQPPAAYSPEAQKLVNSLQNANEWKIAGETGRLVREQNDVRVYVTLHTWHAGVEVSNNDVSGSFTYAEQRAINRAADECRRKLVAQALNPAPKTAKVVRATVDGKVRKVALLDEE